jgi:hypothetical protein
MIHKLGLYTSCNILSSTIHWLWTWNLLWLIKYYKSPYSILIFSTLNYRLRLRSILHPFIWVSSGSHLYSWISLFIIVPSLKTPNPYTSCHTTFCGRNDMCPINISFVLKTRLFEIRFQYGVFVSPAYSSPFSRLSFVYLSITCQFASKSNFRYKLQVTI